VQVMRFTQANYNHHMQWSRLRSAVFVHSLRSLLHKNGSTPAAH